MPVVQKDILYPGNWHLRDGRVFKCTPDDVKHFATRLGQMVDAGLHVPFAWEHQDALKPTTREAFQKRNAELAKLTIGHAKGAKVGAKGEIIAPLDVSADDEPYLRKVKFVSPQIEWDYRDPTGRVWPGPSITHIAATPVPVQHTQQPFRLSAGLEQFREPIRLSLAAYEPVKLGDAPPFPPKKKKGDDDSDDASTVDDDADPDLDADADDLDDLGDDTAAVTPGDDAKPPEGDADASPTPAPAATPEDKTAGSMTTKQPHPKMTELLSLLAQSGHPLPDDTDAENLIDRLITSLMATNAAENGPAPTPHELAPPVISMSQTQIDRLAALEKKAVENARKDVERRIDALQSSGRVSPAIADKLRGELKTVSLSVNDAGDLVPVGLLTKIEAYEELPANKVIDERRVTEVPLSASGMFKDDNVQPMTDEMIAMAGGPDPLKQPAKAS